MLLFPIRCSLVRILIPRALAELADSIREMGLIQPLIVQLLPSADAEATPQRYQLIAGERRWRAAQIAGLRHLDVIVKDVTPQETLELALVENIQRAEISTLLKRHRPIRHCPKTLA